ncbi:AtpZ/AtpI family protein [Fusobacterium sp. MFO224]|uniref:AtpZ/AtpI family protein n=1 Tax=Fusobacterium sp. MFO224 TaxID=3378070 RepID=UPI003854D3ED
MFKLNKEMFKYFNLFGTIGFTIIFSVLLAIIIYKIIEKYFIKSTIIFIGLVVFGVINGLYNVYKMIFKK